MHQIYVGTDSEKQPFFLSVVLTDSNNQGAPQYKAILWKKTVSTAFSVRPFEIDVAAINQAECTARQ